MQHASLGLACSPAALGLCGPLIGGKLARSASCTSTRSAEIVIRS